MAIRGIVGIPTVEVFSGMLKKLRGHEAQRNRII